MSAIINLFILDQLDGPVDYESLEELVADAIAECGHDIDDLSTEMLSRLMQAADPNSTLYSALQTEWADRQG